MLREHTEIRRADWHFDKIRLNHSDINGFWDFWRKEQSHLLTKDAIRTNLRDKDGVWERNTFTENLQ